MADTLQYGLTLTGLLNTENNELIPDECVLDYTSALQSSTAAQITRTNDLIGSTLCAGENMQIVAGSATMGFSGSQVGTSVRGCNL